MAGPTTRTSSAPFLCVDLDGTTVDRNGAWRSWVSAYSAATGRSLDDAIWMMDIDAGGLGDRSVVFELICERFGGNATALYADYRETVASCIEVLPTVVEGLERICAAGWTVSAVSNGDGAVQRAKAERTGLSRYFADVVVSGDVGIRKPDRAIFELAAARCDTTLATAWMIGDSAPADIGGADAAGMRSVWMTMNRRWDEALYAPTASALTFAEAIDIVLAAD
jgi:putative hydrolase of the HAD superfamily